VAVGHVAVFDRLAGLDPATYRPHFLHAEDRIWSETNCYVDLWIEMLHALGADPLPVAAFCLSADFEGTQWSFFKPSPEDIRAVYGIEVGEMNVWRSVLDHVEEELSLGRTLTVEVDSWYLPDTIGVSYRTEHVKTSIAPALVDRGRRVLRYFHGSGFYQLRGDDFDGIFAPALLPPYVELVRLNDLRVDTDEQIVASLELARAHLRRRPAENPVVRLGRRLSAISPWLATQGPEVFHQLAFGTCRQLGATAEVGSSYLDWLDRRTALEMTGAAESLRQAAEHAKALQFSLARAARGRSVNFEDSVASLAAAWDRGLDLATVALAAA
jgi:hypothetical protein